MPAMLCCAEPPHIVVLLQMQVASYSSCSAEVDRVMSADVMRSCLVLVEDLLDVLPVLLYQVATLQAQLHSYITTWEHATCNRCQAVSHVRRAGSSALQLQHNFRGVSINCVSGYMHHMLVVVVLVAFCCCNICMVCRGSLMHRMVWQAPMPGSGACTGAI